MTSIGSTFLILTRDKAPHKIEVKIKLTEMVRLSFRVIKEGTLLGKNGAIMVAKPRTQQYSDEGDDGELG